jgi:hypothetical protein
MEISPEGSTGWLCPGTYFSMNRANELDGARSWRWNGMVSDNGYTCTEGIKRRHCTGVSPEFFVAFMVESTSCHSSGEHFTVVMNGTSLGSMGACGRERG